MQKAKNGFNILEIIIATAILLVAVTVTFEIIPGIYRLNQKAWNMSRASFLAQEKLDELTEKNIFIDTVQHNDNPAGIENCTRSWVGIADPFGNAAIQVVKVKVQWTERGKTREVEVQGLVSP
jgi:prepilin-type N-terminal cleavage/methylation domain-containing protein